MRNEARFDPLSSGVTLLHAAFQDYAFERHSHDAYAIGTTLHGIQRYTCKGRQFDSRAGDLVLFNPDEDHDGRCGTAEGFRYALWYVDEELVRSSLDGEGGAGHGRYFASPHVTDRRMAASFLRLSASLAGAPRESLRGESLIAGFLRTILRRHGEKTGDRRAHHGGAGNPALARVKDYIRTSYAQDLTVAELAAEAGLSRAHLTSAFSSAYHMPPHVYLNAVRIAEAQKMIRDGLPLTTVALDCGFADQSHFTRRFKGAVGVTPSVWRRMVGG